ncbi:unnamed protein product [Adineta ricciae]|nr:unnamed protein product [Adineta ricciae]
MSEFITEKNINIFDLPHEMLIAIFNKLNKIDVFYSIINVNQYMDQVILDPLFIRDLNFTRELMPNNTCSIENHILDKICERILPKINDKVNKLTLEPISIERILSNLEYPKLDCLSLVNFQQEILLKYFTDETYTNIRHLFLNQIKNLQIGTCDEISSELNLFSTIISSCKYLNELDLYQIFNDRGLATSISNHSLTSCSSSSLIKLEIYVNTFEDCLYLLDGRLPCLSTLIIHVLRIVPFSSHIDNTKKLPKLKCFSLASYRDTKINESTYIDGNDLYDNICNYMPRLNQFTFSITTFIDDLNRNIYLPSNNEVQASFIGRYKQKVGSYVNTCPSKMQSECRVYSLPYQFKEYIDLSNAYSSNRFDKVQHLIMCDKKPFGYELFKLVARDFPFLRELSVCNTKAQEKKKQSYTLITFHYLTALRLSAAHVDYVEQFLLTEKTCLPRLSTLTVEYESLANVTKNFTNDASRQNCAQLKRLLIEEPFVCPKHFHEYFPLL